MASKFGEWWQKVKQHWVAVGVVGIGLVVVVALIIFGYRLDWTGFNGDSRSGKTLWDWLQLLIIPIMLAIGGFWLNQIQKSREEKATELRTKIERKAAETRAQTEREIAQDNQREAALQEYIDKMSELLLHEKLRESQPESEVRKIARVRTLTVLPRLDGGRKRSVVQFLQESGLIDKDKRIVALNEADLRNADLSDALLAEIDLRETNLSYADLSGANLNGAQLTGAHLTGAYLCGANLSDADLHGVDLSEAVLGDNNLHDANLSKAKLEGADLNGADLEGADLSYANLRGADLRGAHLQGTDLHGAYLWEADLSRADLSDAKLRNLSDADLEGTDLRGADLRANLSGTLPFNPAVTAEQLEKAASLQGATMPDGSIHP